MVQIRHAVIVMWLGTISSTVSAETLDDILARVMARSKAYSTVDCKWQVVSEFTDHPKNRTSIDPFGDGSAAELKQPLPVTLTWSGSFQSDWLKVRLNYDEPLRSFPAGRIQQQHRTVVSDGVESRSLEPHETYTRATWMKAQNPWNVGYSPQLVPLFTQFRAYHYPIASLFPPEAIDAQVEPGQWDGHECVVVRRKHPGQEVGGRKLPTYQMWLDPQADYSVRRHTATSGAGILRDDVRIELGQRDGMWVPERWQWFEYDDSSGKLLASHSAKVLEISLNQPLDKSLFELPFPRGTIVSDQRLASERELLIGTNQREFVLTRQQRNETGSWPALLEELERQ